ncbi:hypothetical protein [Kitasatospora purpeofusca]|uniref:hypothetical protein n=1 Tax=Kitasatospora purpeofusca TaxID=67352 RepID=UPI00386E958F|nr:hypothetical protein OIP63_19745 [Kitasatospora purpeofusca]
MRTSIMPASAKNTVVRRRVAAVAATVLLAGSVQLLTAESSWACGSSDGAVAAAPKAAAKTAAPKAGTPKAGTPKADAPKTEAATHDGAPGIGFHMTPSLAVTAGGPKVDIGVGIGNFTGAPYRNVVPTLSLATHLAGDGEGGVSYVDSKYLAVEYNADGTWKKLPLRRGCDPTLFATPAKGVPVADGHANHVTFRVGLAADAPADLDLIYVGLGATAEDGSRSEWAQKEMTVTVPKAAKPAPTTTPAKPAPAKPAKTAETAKPAARPTTPAKPAAKPAPVSDNTPAATAKPAAPAAAPAPAAPSAPKSTPTAAPATTAPAGTPELAQTGAGTPNGLLAGIAAGIAALGAGMVLTVRRLRAQR